MREPQKERREERHEAREGKGAKTEPQRQSERGGSREAWAFKSANALQKTLRPPTTGRRQLPGYSWPLTSGRLFSVRPRQAVHYWPPIRGHLLLATCCWLPTTGRKLLTAGYWLAAYYWLPATGRLLVAANYWPPTTHRALLATCDWPPSAGPLVLAP